MLIATYFTPSHKDMAERFVLNRWEQAGFDDCISCEVLDQDCPTATFKQPGWNECTADKIAWLSEMPMDSQPVLFVDADVAVFAGAADMCRKVLDTSNDTGEMFFQNDYVQLCTGVMLFRRTPAVLGFLDFWCQFCSFTAENDQDGLHLLQSARKAVGMQGHIVSTSAVASDMWANWRGLGNEKPWQGEPIDPPPTMTLWHANWCVGVEAKTKMLEQVVATHDARLAG
jgi:hypothetical protein